MLALINNHPRDERIIFEEVQHKYTIDGQTDYASATTFIKTFFNEFDADQVLGKMLRFGTFEKKYGTKTIDQVKEEWKENGRASAERGTMLHKYIEMFYNAVEYQEKTDLTAEISLFFSFVKTLSRNYVPYRTEWFVFDEEYKIAGSIDMIFQIDSARPNVVAVYDWKCSKEIKRSNRYEKGRGVLNHLDDCNGNHYNLQLNLYKYILQKNYNLIVKEMKLVVIHRNNSDVLLLNVPDMTAEIKQMLCCRV